jgi:hypothetical protein
MFRDSNCQFARMAYVFISDDCYPLSMREDARDLWPSLICIGCLTRVELVESNSGSGAHVIVSTQGKEHTMRASLDYPGLKRITNNNILASLPLVIVAGAHRHQSPTVAQQLDIYI